EIRRLLRQILQQTVQEGRIDVFRQCQRDVRRAGELLSRLLLFCTNVEASDDQRLAQRGPLGLGERLWPVWLLQILHEGRMGTGDLEPLEIASHCPRPASHDLVLSLTKGLFLSHQAQQMCADMLAALS